MSAIHMKGVAIRRGDRMVVSGVDITFAAGRLTAVIGPNGAGKSTLLECAAGLLAPASGAVLLGGTALTALGRRELARRRAYLPQRAWVEWPISVERVVALGLTPSLPAFGGLPAALQPAIERALADCDLLALRDRPATHLSGGELARTMLARAIVSDPELLIVDEPTAGLDPRHAQEAMRRLRARADAGRTVVLSVHELDFALRYADDVVAVRDGRVMWAGPAAEAMTEANLERLFDVRLCIIRDGAGASLRYLD